MYSNNYTIKSTEQQKKTIESSIVNQLNTEQYTYYPTWYTTQTQTSTNMPTVTKTTSYGSIVDEITHQQQQPSFLRNVEDIVITGVSGRFAQSENIEEFAQNLYNKETDLFTEEERRWSKEIHGTQKRNVTINKEISKFDAEFFGLTQKQVENMDQKLRSLLEVAYEAIFDSGINVNELRGSRTGVFVGTCKPEELTVTGKSMLASRLSFFFDFKGPAVTIDTVRSSSLVALDEAINAIKTGQCDYAIVAGVDMLVRPQTTLQYQRQPVIDDKLVTVSAVLLQKKQTCRRFYAKVLHSKVNNKQQGLKYPIGEIQTRLLKEIYAECNIDPSLVTYVEVHDADNKVTIQQGLNTVADVFTSPRVSRTVPVFVGSTEMEQTEKDCGIIALVKMLISIQRGIIPANLRYQEPTQEITALVDGRVKIVNQHSKFYGGLMALNSMGCDGLIAHIVLQPHSEYIMSKLGAASFWNQDLTEIAQQPRLFQFCARTRQGLEQVIDEIERNPTDLAKHCLLQPNSTHTPITHPFRGYTVLNTERKIKEIQQVKILDTKVQSRPVWYIFSGIGSQWQNMGQDLMKIDTFRQSIIRSAEYLRPYGLNLIDIMYGKNVYENTVNSFVGIAAIQIALVDCLRQAGVEADGIIGHSVGELACAYADKCLTAEETLLVAYYRGKCIEEAQLPQGAMAIVGMTWEECQRRCPSGIVPACHNSKNTVTISGPKKAIVEFIEQLKIEGVFAKELETSNVAYHSYYMTSIAPALRVALEKVIRTQKQRSERWISTSIPEQRWETDLARFSSVDYFVNNLCSPVLFQEALKHIPTNAITIEIAPHALLQTILKNTLPQETVTVVSLMNKDSYNHVEYFLQQIGRLYIEGVNVDSVKLFVPYGREHTVYPVPVQTPFLSNLVRWNHRQEWNTPKYETEMLVNNNTWKYVVDVDNVVDDAYLAGHQIEGQFVYPVSGYLHLVWKSLAKMNGFQQFEQMPIVFENVDIRRQTIIPAIGKITFTVTVMPKTGLFEVYNELTKCVIATGRCFVPEESMNMIPVSQKLQWTTRQSSEIMDQEEIYNELGLRGYNYKNEFQPIIKTDVEGKWAELSWTGKWVPYLDAMLQLSVLGQKRGLLLPTRIKCVKIDPKVHTLTQKLIKTEMLKNYIEIKKIGSIFNQEKPTYFTLPAVFDRLYNKIVSGGVEIVEIETTPVPRRQFYEQSILEQVSYVPYFEKHFEEDYVIVDKINKEEQEMSLNKSIEQEEEFESVIRQSREFYEFYLNECKRYTTHILRKIEYPTTATIAQTIVPTPFPKSLLMKFEELNIKTPTMPVTVQQQYTQFLEGGKLLQLLTYVANIDSTDGQYFLKVQKIFNEKFAYYRAIEEDRILNFLNKRSTFLKSFLDTVVENLQFVDYKQEKKLRVLEISPCMTQFFGVKVNKFLKNHPELNTVDYKYVPTMFDTHQIQTEEYLNELNKCVETPIEKVEWNFGLRNGKLTTETPAHLKNFDLIIFNGSLSTLMPYVSDEYEIKKWLQTIVEKVMKPQGFMFVHEFTNNFDALNQFNLLEQIVFRQQYNSKQITKYTQPIQYLTEKKWRQIIEEAGFFPVSLKSDTQLSTMFLYRKPVSFVNTITTFAPVEEKIIIDDMDKFTWIEKVKLAMNNKCIERVWLISEKAPMAIIVGLINCLRSEMGGEKIRCIFVADKQPIYTFDCLINDQLKTNTLQYATQWTQLFDQIRKADLVMNVFQAGKWCSFRHLFDECLQSTLNEKILGEQQLRINPTELRNAYIKFLTRGGDLFNWMHPEETTLNETEKQVFCYPVYAGLNSLISREKSTLDYGVFGMEFSGYVKDESNKRVMGMLPVRDLTRTVVVDSEYLWEVPSEWTLEQAATVPVAYSAAYYSLVIRGGLKQGETVLIHTDSDDIEQAAIAVCLYHKCKVIVVVSSEEERQYLKKMFVGQLSDECIVNNKEMHWEKQIMQITYGRGVDCVLNTVVEERVQTLVRVLAQQGRFLNIGKFDLEKRSQWAVSFLLKSIDFHEIQLETLFEEESLCEWTRVYEFIEEGIRSGFVRPLNFVIFEKEQIEQAVATLLYDERRFEKVLIKVAEPRKFTILAGLSKVWFSPSQTYVITGGLSNFGFELAQWMVERGARHLVITSRTGVIADYQKKNIKNLEQLGAIVKVIKCELKNEEECYFMIQDAIKMSVEKKIGGIMHLAQFVEDRFESDYSKLITVTETKCPITYNLDKHTRSQEIMDDSALFVVFTSINKEENEYERICECRRRDNKHALVIQWAGMDEFNVFFETRLPGEREAAHQLIVSCLKNLEHVLGKSMELKNNAIWSTFVPVFEKQINERKFEQKRQVKKSLVEMIVNILGIKDTKQIKSEEITLGEMGLDTLMFVEIKHILEQTFNLPLNIKEIQQLTIEKLRLIEREFTNNMQVPLYGEQKQTIKTTTTTTTTFVDVPVQATTQRTYLANKINYLMPTKVVEKLNLIEFVPQQQIPVFVIHPIEGHVNMLRSWAKHMKYPVFGLQYTKEAMQYETIEQLADFYWQQIETELLKYQTSGVVIPRVHLCGYSFGGSVAFEMALNRIGRVASFTLLDGIHSGLTAQINQYKNKFQFENTLENECEALLTFVQQYTQIPSRREFIDILCNLDNFDQRVKYTVYELLNKSQFNFDQFDLEQACRSFVTKLFMSYRYQPKMALRLPEMLLIKSGQRSELINNILGGECGLNRLFNGKLQIETVDGDHRSFLEANNGFQVACILNEFLLRCF